MAYTAEMYFLTAVEDGSPRPKYWQGYFLVSLSPWLTDGPLLAVSSLVRLIPAIFSFSYKGTSSIELGPHTYLTFFFAF